MERVPPENWPDLDVISVVEKNQPEELEGIRESALELVRTFNEDGSYEEFEQKIEQFFTSLGIPPVMEGAELELNAKSWKRAFENRNGYLNENEMVDIEVHGPGKTYGNFYLATEGGVTMVVPGACSFPQEKTPDIHGILPEKNFYRVFEEVIGVEPFRKDLRREGLSVFTVSENGVVRIPLSEVDIDTGWDGIREYIEKTKQ